jgi:hypothetical protein
VQPARAHGERQRHDAGTGRERPLRVRTVVEHLGAELVPHDHVARRVEDEQTRLARRSDQLVGVLQGMEVRPADAARERLYEHLAGARLRLGNRVDDEGPVAHDGGSHGAVA